MTTESLGAYEFSLEYKINDKDLKDFNKGTDKATKRVKKMSLALVALGTFSFIKSLGIRDLDNFSQLTRTSTKDIKGLGNAFTQAGLKAEDAQASIEGVGKAVFSASRGGDEAKAFSRLGISTRDSNEKLKTNIQLLKEARIQLRKIKNLEERKEIAGKLGIGKIADLTILRTRLEVETDIKKGGKFAASKSEVESSKELTKSMDKLGNLFGVLGDRIAGVFNPLFTVLTKALNIILGGLLFPEKEIVIKASASRGENKHFNSVNKVNRTSNSVNSKAVDIKAKAKNKQDIKATKVINNLKALPSLTLKTIQNTANNSVNNATTNNDTANNSVNNATTNNVTIHVNGGDISEVQRVIKKTIQNTNQGGLFKNRENR